SSQSGLQQVLLHVPGGLEGKIRVIAGGSVQKSLDGNAGLTVAFSRPISKEPEIELEYVSPLPDWISLGSSGTVSGGGGDRSLPRVPKRVRRLALALVQPLQATRGETKVRLWCDATDLPVSVGEQWEEV